jgi:single-strand DNA-binding protein
MNSINLTGRLTADPETRSTHSATAVTQFRLAVQRRRSREGEDRGAVYVDVVCFGGLAESCGEYLSKGRLVAASGRLEHDEWETEGGERRSRHKVVADEVEFLGGRPDDES